MLKIQNELPKTSSKCLVGFLVMSDINNLNFSEALDKARCMLEEEIRGMYGRMTRQELKHIYPMGAYVSYYKKFGYTYHVLQQLESVAHGKNIPNVSAAVEAMFMAELKNMLLTAGHDLEKIKQPLIIKESSGDESFTGINGKPAKTVPGDIMIMDGESVISSILKGPDSRTRIGSETRQVLFTVYAPAGIDAMDIFRHLSDIESNVRIFSPDAVTRVKDVHGNSQ
ncbi:MAG: hypothetical protein K6T66_13715 [Peptococcaceae bacterium]|nr:hypothetical protein [Peptococcaceae bacterium]